MQIYFLRWGCLVGLIYGFWILSYKPQKNLNKMLLGWSGHCYMIVQAKSQNQKHLFKCLCGLSKSQNQKHLAKSQKPNLSPAKQPLIFILVHHAGWEGIF
jgi:hypothetical protein